MGVDRRIGRRMSAISGEAGKPLSALYSIVLTIYNPSLYHKCDIRGLPFFFFFLLLFLEQMFFVLYNNSTYMTF